MTDGRVRVVEIAQGLAGPVCGRLFAAFGHEVVKCEPRDGDFLRFTPPLAPSGESLAFVAANADKESVIAPFDEPDGRTAIHRMLDDADVAIVDLPPQQARAAGLDPVQVRRSHPDLVVVSVTGFGIETTYSDLPADSLLAEAYGGLAMMIGEPERKPLTLGGEQCAHAAAVTGFLGALLALMRRDQGARGDFIDVAMCDVAAYMDWKSDVANVFEGATPRRSTSDDGGWRLVRARDGWVGVIFQQRHWDTVVRLIGAPALQDPALRDEATRLERSAQWWSCIEEWVSRRTAEAAYEEAQRFGLPFGWVATTADLAESAQLKSRGFVKTADENGATPAVGSLVRCESLPWRTGRAPKLGEHTAESSVERTGSPKRKENSDPGQPLKGVTVLDFGTITAGAAVSRLLADFGATVLKVEWIDKPDTFRWWKMPVTDAPHPSSATDSPYFASNNVGKLGAAINLKQSEGRELLHELARTCDVVIENYRVGVTRRLGIDFNTLKALNPELVYLSLSSQGQQGPEAANSSYGSTLDLLSGLASVTGYDADHPLWSSSNVNYPDQLVSLFGAAAIVYCLWAKISGVHLDVSQREVVSWTLAAQIADFVVNGTIAKATGNRRVGRTPHDVYPCSEPDTWVAVSCQSAAERRALAECLGAPETIDDTDGHWKLDDDALDQLIATWTSRHERTKCVELLRDVGVPAVPVLDTADRRQESRFTARMVTLPDEAMPVKGFPMLFQEHRLSTPAPAPKLGEHTRALLTQMTSLSDEKLDDLQRRGIVYFGDAEPRTPRTDETSVPLTRIEPT